MTLILWKYMLLLTVMESVYSIPQKLRIVGTATMLMLMAVLSKYCSVFLIIFQCFNGKDRSFYNFGMTDLKSFRFTNVDTIASVERIFIMCA